MVEFITENGVELLKAAAQIVGAFAILATMTKNEHDNIVADWLLRIINFFGGNFGRSRNAG